MDSELTTELRAAKEAHFLQQLHLIAVNEPIVRLAREHPGPHAVVTTASRSSTQAVLTFLDLTDLFPVVVSGDDVAEPKPSPEGYVRALGELGVDSAQAMALEDSAVGMEAARRAGLRVSSVLHFCADQRCPSRTRR